MAERVFLGKVASNLSRVLGGCVTATKLLFFLSFFPFFLFFVFCFLFVFVFVFVFVFSLSGTSRVSRV